MLRLCRVVIVGLAPWSASGQAPLVPHVPINLAHVERVRDETRQGDDRWSAPLRRLRADADACLDDGPWSVTDKSVLPPSGDPHDYMSLGPYWWPNPETPDGLPYVRRDGDVNPERARIPDASSWGRMARTSSTLALAAVLLDDEACAERAALLIRTWFIDPETRMHPHLRYGQAIPGRVDGRDIGIIDTREVFLVTDAVRLLEQSHAWTPDDDEAIRAWMRDYLEWLVHGEYRTEGDRRNNHATWYDVQVVSIADLLGLEPLVEDTLRRVHARRIAPYIAVDGEQVEETARTHGWEYS
ncbi:MAG: alginate lyase family protein, partial [Phycisphaerales bacterium]|nr:alginate lyase family protein [Phycisphaerales bacterium]